MQYVRKIAPLAAPLAMAVGALALSGCFLDGDGHMQPGASDATPDAFRPLDGAMLDAFVPVMDAGPPVDAGPMDAELPGDDGGVPMDAPMDAFVPMDAGPPDAGPPDAGPPDTGPPDTGPPDTGPPDTGPPDTGPPDTGPPDTGPPPLRDCETLYGGMSGVSVCGETATRCRLFYSSDDGDCQDVCGTDCVESFNNGAGCSSAGGSTSCNTDRFTQICICDRVP